MCQDKECPMKEKLDEKERRIRELERAIRIALAERNFGAFSKLAEVMKR